MTPTAGRPGRRMAIAMAAVALAGCLVGCERVSPDATRAGAGPATTPAAGTDLVRALTTARLATVRYATDLRAAQADGYRLRTPYRAGLGVDYLNPDVTGFDLQRPPILVYVGRGDRLQLGALAWVFPAVPAAPPLPGATYGWLDAACRYADGWSVVADGSGCQPNHPTTNAPFLLRHPGLVTLHVWLWYPNPDGIFHSTNPLVRPYALGPRTQERTIHPREGESTVPRYLVERTFPDGLRIPATDAGADACMSVAEANSAERVTWVHSYVTPDRGKTYCVYDGPDPAAIRRAAEKNGLPVDSITEVRVLDPYFYH